MNAPAAEIHVTTGMPKRSAAKPAIVNAKKPPTSSPTPMIKPSAVATARGKHLTISEIAFRWDFSNSAHFSHSYRTRFGASSGRLVLLPHK